MEELLKEGTLLREGLFLQVCMFIAVLLFTIRLLKTKPEFGIGERLLRDTIPCFFVLLPYYALYIGDIGSIADVLGLFVYCISYGLWWGAIAEGIIALFHKIVNK